MSDDEAGLTELQLNALRHLLETAEAEAIRELSSSSAEARPVDLALSIGRLSRMDAIQQQQMALARGRRIGLQLQQVHAAIGRITAGSYGACLKCGEPIGYRRLSVQPQASLCRACQAGGS